MRVFEPSEYLTRKQAATRFLRRLDKPQPPQEVVSLGTGLQVSGRDQYAYADLRVTPPATPAGVTADPYIVGYLVELTLDGDTRVRAYDAVPTIRVDYLMPGRTYQVRVCAVDYTNQAGDYGESSDIVAPRDLVAPDKPAFKVTAADTGAAIEVTQFNSEIDFAGYDLFRDTVPTLKSNPALLPCGSFFDKTYADRSVPANGGYYYFLRAKDYSGNSTDSDVVGPVQLVGTGVPLPAVISLATATAVANADGTIAFTFPKSAAANKAQYNIWRKRVGGSTWTLLDTIAIPEGDPAMVEYLDQTAVSGFEYQYAATVVNTTGDESLIDSVNSVSATAADHTAPQPIPNDITYRGILGGIEVTWESSPDPSVKAYIVRWRYAQVGAANRFNTGVKVEGTSYTLSGLIDPATGLPPTRDALANVFEVEIAAVDADDNQSAFVARIDERGYRVPVEFPELAGYRAADDSVPPAPAISGIAINSDGSITLTWQPPNITDLLGFLIDELKSGSSEWESIRTITDGSVLERKFTVNGLEPFKYNQRQYRFRVRTLDNTGNLSSVNLLDNPSFENDLAGWTTATEAGLVHAVVAGLGRNGKALRSNLAGRAYQVIPVQAGRTYTFSAFVRLDTTGTPAAVASIRLSWMDEAQATLRNDACPSVELSAVYQRISVTGTAPAGAVSVAAYLDGSDAGTVLWDDIQLEEGVRVSPYGDGKTDWLRAVDTQGPPAYATQFEAAGRWGYFMMFWVNGTDPDYINCSYEIWRKRTGSDAPGFTPDADFVKLIEIPGHNDGKLNHWDDNTPDENERMKVIYALRPRDRFGNAAVDADGKPVFMATTAEVQSLNTNDKEIVTKNDTTWVEDVIFDDAVPVKPANVAARGAAGGIILNWDPSTTPGVTKYSVYIPALPQMAARTIVVSGTTVTIALPTGPDSATVAAMQITVKAVSRSGNQTSDPVAVSSWDMVGYVRMDSIKPDPPAAIRVTTSNSGSIYIEWDRSPSPDVNMYILQYSLDAGVHWNFLAMSPTPPTQAEVLSFRMSGLKPYAETRDVYWFRVYAIDSSNWASDPRGYRDGSSNYINCYIPRDITPPVTLGSTNWAGAVSVTSNVVDSADATSPCTVQVAWPQNTYDNDIDHYDIRCSRSDSAADVVTQQVPKDVTAYTFKGLIQGKTYNFDVRATDTSGNVGDWSPVQSATTPLYSAPPPTYTKPVTPVVSGVYNTDSNATELDWSPYDRAGQKVAQFLIYRKLGTTGTYSQYGTSTTTSYVDTRALRSTTATKTYYYYVVAVCGDGTTKSDPSSEEIVVVPIADTTDPNSCYTTDMFVTDSARAGGVGVGMEVDGVDDGLTVQRKWTVETYRKAIATCVRLIAENGAEAVLSDATPMVLRDNSQVLAWEMDNREVLTDVGNGLEWSKCRLEEAGVREVAHIYIGGHVYRGGVVPGKWLYSHNVAGSTYSTK